MRQTINKTPETVLLETMQNIDSVARRSIQKDSQTELTAVQDDEKGKSECLVAEILLHGLRVVFRVLAALKMFSTVHRTIEQGGGRLV